jgi:uncharacterized membrane protein
MNSPNPEQEKGTLSSLHGIFGLPLDMKIILLWTALCIVSIYTPVINQSFLRIILALPLILFIPGYVLLAALFPDSKDIDAIERIVLSIGTSIVVTPLIGLCLNFTSWGIRLNPLILSLTALIVVLVIFAEIRRTRTSPESRYTIPVPEIRQTVQDEWAMRKGSKRDRILFFASIFAIGLVILSAVLVITLPKPGEKFSEFFILGENRTADSYPRVILPDISYPMYVGIGNHEFRTINYSVELYLVPKPVNETIVATLQPETILVKTYSVTLSHNETSVIPFDLIVPDNRYNRMDFLLFDETPPGSDITGLNRVPASYRNLHLGFNVTTPTTDFFIQGENRTAAAYPKAINSKTSHTVYVGVGNHEFRMMNYTVEMYLAPQSVNESAVASSQFGALPLNTYTVVLNHNQTSILPVNFSVSDAGNYRMDFLVFNETVPSQYINGSNRVNASYRNLYLGFNVTSQSPLKNTTAIP